MDKDTLVNNAGITRDNAFPALSDEDWDEVIDTSLGGFYNVVQPLVMPMVRAKQGGRIVTIASVAGIIALTWKGASKTWRTRDLLFPLTAAFLFAARDNMVRFGLLKITSPGS